MYNVWRIGKQVEWNTKINVSHEIVISAFLFLKSVSTGYAIVSLYNEFSLYSCFSDRASSSLEPYPKYLVI